MDLFIYLFIYLFGFLQEVLQMWSCALVFYLQIFEINK